MRHLAIKRIDDPPEPDDGYRILVDRVWPRGLSKSAAAIDHWAKDAAPSTALRKWFNHDPARWAEFQLRYRGELAANAEAIEALRALCKGRRVTLLFGARDVAHNQAVVLRDVLRQAR